MQEPRKKLLQSTKLKPIIFGVSPRGILRVDPKTKELLGFWHYNVLKNWAYSKRTFVLVGVACSHGGVVMIVTMFCAGIYRQELSSGIEPSQVD